MTVDLQGGSGAAPPRRQRRSLRLSAGAPQWNLLLLGALLLMLIAGTVSWEARRVEQERFAAFSKDLQHLAEVLDETLARQLENIDSALLILRAEYQDHHGDMERTIALLKRGPLKGVDVHVTVIGSDGYAAFTDVPGAAQATYLGDRAHFRVFADGGADRLYISDPVLGRLTKRWGLQLARPVLGKGGEFLGVIVVFLPPEQLTRFMQPLNIGSDTIMSVISVRGTLVSRSRELEKYRGSQLSAEQISDYRRAPTGFSLRPSVLDQVERGIAHRWVKDYPLLLIVSRAADVLHAEVAAQQQPLMVLGSSAGLVLIASFLLLARSLQRRQQIELRLREAHDHLLQAQAIAHLGSWDFDVASGTLNWSDEVFRIFEINPAESPVSYQAARARFHPDDAAIAHETYAAAAKTGRSYEITHRLLMDGGRIKWVHSRGDVSLDEQGRSLRLAGTVQDISQRKREEAQREALVNEKLLLLESTGEGIYGIDTEGLCTFINQAGAYMLGYEVADLIGKDIHELVHDRHADGSPYPVAQCPVYLASVSGRSCRRADEVFWRRDGTAVPVEYAAHPIRDAERVTGTVVTFTDISQRKHAEVELRIAETAFQTQEGMFVTDDHGVILRVNQAFSEITGYTAAEIVGRNPRFRSSGRHDAAFYAAMWARLASTGAWKGEIWNRRKNGEIYPESVTITAVKGEGAGVTHYVATMHDISERKAAEQQIHQLAFFDALTQLPNRRLLMDRLHQALATSARSHAHGALMFIDLDRFKLLNDSHGHDVGDLLLQQVALRLQGCVREVDTVARLGGDEFVVLLEALSEEPAEARLQARRVARKILDTLNQPYELAGRSHESTPSMGAVLFCGQTPGVDDLLKQADLAMYRSKAAGRNQVSFFAAAMLDEDEPA